MICAVSSSLLILVYNVTWLHFPTYVFNMMNDDNSITIKNKQLGLYYKHEGAIFIFKV